MNIVFLTNQYYPNAFANGICVHQVALSCKNAGHKVYVVCYGNNKQFKRDSYQGIEVVQIPLPNDDFLRSEAIKGTMLAPILNTMARCLGIIKKFAHLRKYPIRSHKLVDDFYEATECIIKKDGVDRLVCTYTPIEAVVAGAKIKEKYTNIIASFYSLDTLSNEFGYGLLPTQYRRKKGLSWEMLLFSIYDKIICPECHRKHYESSAFDQFKSKIVFANFPLFAGSNGCQKDVIKNKRIVYAGTLYKKIRNPKCAINLLIPVLKENELHFYGRGDCDDILSKCKGKFPAKIFNHGYVVYERIIEEISSANILLSIGNKETPMAPSKIFEYIATGKPIIHVYFEDSDPCIEPLLNYGNAIIIKYNETNIQKLEEFIENAHSIDVDQLKNRFINATPDYTSEIILS